MKKEIQDIIKIAISKAFEGKATIESSQIIVEYPRNETFGDYTTNVAMILAKDLRKNPMEVAERLLSVISNQLSAKDKFEKIEIAKPGHVNFYLSKEYLQGVVKKIEKEKEDFGNLPAGRQGSEIGNGMKINNEFISANPTGPLHLGNGRGGFFGDSLARVLRKAGFEVVNEYYVNDAGEQVLKLGHSVLKDDEAIYAGEYIDDLNSRYIKEGGDARDVGEKASKEILENILKPTIGKKMKISFDSWISEKKDLYETGLVDEAIEILQEKGRLFEKEGALWLKATEFGDDKDRVLIKSDGQKTYFASDCGYILSKMKRGFEVIVEIWGADHHGYVKRFEAAAGALGFKGELRFILVQLVRLVKDGREVRMSKRSGNVVYIDDLIEELGHDVTRFFFLMYSPDTHMNFDLGLAKERSSKNPVFYVQYAHARICSILKNATSHKSQVTSHKDVDLSSLKDEKELALMRELNKFPELIIDLAESYEIHKLTHYAIRLADRFHSFYAECKVIDEEKPELTKARVLLVDAVKTVLGESLELIGVDAPEKM